MAPSDESRHNRTFWERESLAYQRVHGPALASAPMAWGVWRVPEKELRVLGDVCGRAILELGCGAARWSEALARSGAWAVGMDFSAAQLANAVRAGETGVDGVDGRPVLVQADGTQLPFALESFDIVFCDHGVMSFANPCAAIAEAARVLRPGGRLAFCTSSPLRDICWDEQAKRVTERLVTSTFDLGPVEDDGCVVQRRSHGAWIRLFGRHGLRVDDLIEIQAPPAAATTYADFVPADWARRGRVETHPGRRDS
ncbi:MAG: class I SAM-dependent methyltransferase [Acidobacteriota bacterium]